MSYIHEALKKAQVERDLGKRPHGNLPAPRRKRSFFTTRRVMLLAALGVLVLLAFAGYSWWDQKIAKQNSVSIAWLGASKRRAITAEKKGRAVSPNQAVNRSGNGRANPGNRARPVKKSPVVAPDPKVSPEEKVAAPYETARALHREGRLMDAAKWYDKVISMDPGHVEALNNRGVLYLHEKNYGAARKSFLKATRLRPDYVDAYYNLACVSAAEGRLQQGLQYLGKAVSLNRDVRGWAQKDPDLDPLRSSPRFQEMVVNE